jgi:hypothetical protein
MLVWSYYSAFNKLLDMPRIVAACIITMTSALSRLHRSLTTTSQRCVQLPSGYTVATANRLASAGEATACLLDALASVAIELNFLATLANASNKQAFRAKASRLIVAAR